MRLKRPKQHYDLMEIIWDDAAGLRLGWSNKNDPLEPFIVISVGFLIRETDDHILIAQDTDGDGGHNGRTQIPKPMIKNRRVLRKADYKKEIVASDQNLLEIK